MNRYTRQLVLPQIGEAGQARLASARVVVLGCGALGSVVAEQLARAGVGRLRLVDRDIVELSNLQRQVLFDESDAASAQPKAVAAARRLVRVNSEISVQPIISDVHAGNIESILTAPFAGESSSSPAPPDLLVDGTDNAETRYLVNDLSIKLGFGWVYGACVGVQGRVMAIIPEVTPCLRCIFADAPGVGELPTCETAGVLGPAAAVVASLQALTAIRMLVEKATRSDLITLDLWDNRLRVVPLDDARRSDCPACVKRNLEFLHSTSTSPAASLCGRDSVQVRPTLTTHPIDLASLQRRCAQLARVEVSPYLLRLTPHDRPEFRLTVFTDGRTIVHGTSDISRARSLVAQYVGI